MSDRSVQADVVKKAVLKYKASKLRGTTGSSVQGVSADIDCQVVNSTIISTKYSERLGVYIFTHR